MKKTATAAFILLLVSIIIIFFQFNKVPKKLAWDEVEFARLALSLKNQTYTPYSQLATGHSTLYFYILLASINIFGLTNFALRFPSALFGILNIMSFYLISRIVFAKISYFPDHFLKHKSLILIKSLIPFFLSLILISSRWYFNFARFSFEATFLLFLELTSIYFFLKFALLSFWQAKRVQNRSLKQRFRSSRNDNIIFLVLSAVFSGFAFLSYYPGRIFFLLPLIFLVFYSAKKFLSKNIFLFLFIILITTSPLLVYLGTHKDLRIQEQLFFTDKKLTLQKKISYFGLNAIKLAYMFTHYGDLNGRHNYPGKAIFNPVAGAFFLFGFLVTILNIKNFYNQFFLTYFIISLLPAFFTYPIENPNSLRSYTAIIPSIYFVGNGIIYLLQSEQKSKILLFGATLFLLVLFTLSSLYDLRTYFLYQRQVFSKSFELNGTIQRILNLKLWEKTNPL